MDVLRLEPNLLFQNASWELYRHDVQGPDGKPVTVYYRENQRRERPETDGEFCLSPEETGVVIRARQQDLAPPDKASPGKGVPVAKPPPTPKRVSQKLLDATTVLVKPWWLYRDYRAASPTQLYGQGWKDPDPEYKPVESLLTDSERKPVTEIRICREEAQRLDSGHIYASGRTKAPPKDAKLPGVRLRPAPLDRPYATQHQGQPVACDTRSGLDYAPDCGCGVGLERCIPGDSNNSGNAFYYPNHMPLGPGMPLDDARQAAAAVVSLLVVARGRALPGRSVRQRPRLPRDPHGQAARS